MKPRHIIIILSAVNLLSTGCHRQPANASDSSRPTAIPKNSFRLTIEPIITDHDTVVSLLEIHAPHNASLSINGVHFQSMVNLATSLADAPCAGRIVLSASRFAKSGDDLAYIKTFVHVESTGASAGGPSLYPIPATATLERFFSISITNGDYKLDTPVNLGRFDSQPLILTVMRPAK